MVSWSEFPHVWSSPGSYLHAVWLMNSTDLGQILIHVQQRVALTSFETV